MSPGTLPALNAVLNTTAAILLVVGHHMIRTGRVEAHRRFMIATVVVSVLFLISYLTYHALYGSQPFWGSGWLKAVYLVILGTHSVCAAGIVPMVLITLYYGLRRRDEKHKRIARWTYPLWVYVSVTGVVVYLMLYQLKPVAGG